MLPEVFGTPFFQISGQPFLRSSTNILTENFFLNIHLKNELDITEYIFIIGISVSFLKIT